MEKSQTMAENNTTVNLQDVLAAGMDNHQAGRLDLGEQAYLQVLKASPDHADANHLLGVIAYQRGQHEQAIRLISKAIVAATGSAPGLYAYHCNLGNAQKDFGRLDEAVDSYSKALAIEPNAPEIHNNLGTVLKEQGRLDDAMDHYRKAIGLKSDYADALYNLGNALKYKGEFDSSIAYFTAAIAIQPGYTKAHANMGNALRAVGLLQEAIESFQRAIELSPDYAEAYSNLGNVLTDQGKFDEAISWYEKAMVINLTHPHVLKNYLHTLLYKPDLDNQALFDTYRRITDYVSPPPATLSPVSAEALAPGARLRIGYLTSDFRDHPVGRNILPLLENHDHGKFEIFCYGELGQSDSVTERFERLADQWRVVNGLSDLEIAEKIRADGVHVMIYVGGHFDKNRPSVALFRPAPVQVSFHGGATSALPEMDYWLTDDVLHPTPEQGGTTEQFTEELVRLPSFYNYPALENAPDVSSLPADTNGFITFVSFNKPSKINDTVIELWSRVLDAVPKSRILLKFKNLFEVPTILVPLLERFASNGIAASRIDLRGGVDLFRDHLAGYHDADIGLDPFPFAGATTTFQALWMGVPVISKMGERFISRAGGSMAIHAGLPELSVDTAEDYIAVAKTLAGDLPRLRELRATLRGTIAASQLCDGPGYAANVETALMALWEKKIGGSP